ncbi:MAG: hypothetical protein ACOYNY_17510 [Caldilineaceae bacterium]
MAIEFGLLLSQLINLLFLAVWPFGALFALLALRRRRLPAIATALWVALLILLPVLGVIAFWLVNPHNPEENLQRS